jgi:hypothetical protein
MRELDRWLWDYHHSLKEASCWEQGIQSPPKANDTRRRASQLVIGLTVWAYNGKLGLSHAQSIWEVATLQRRAVGECPPGRQLRPPSRSTEHFVHNR